MDEKKELETKEIDIELQLKEIVALEKANEKLMKDIKLKEKKLRERSKPKGFG